MPQIVSFPSHPKPLNEQLENKLQLLTDLLLSQKKLRKCIAQIERDVAMLKSAIEAEPGPRAAAAVTQIPSAGGRKRNE